MDKGGGGFAKDINKWRDWLWDEMKVTQSKCFANILFTKVFGRKLDKNTNYKFIIEEAELRNSYLQKITEKKWGKSKNKSLNKFFMSLCVFLSR